MAVADVANAAAAVDDSAAGASGAASGERTASDVVDADIVVGAALAFSALLASGVEDAAPAAAAGPPLSCLALPEARVGEFAAPGCLVAHMSAAAENAVVAGSLAGVAVVLAAELGAEDGLEQVAEELAGGQDAANASQAHAAAHLAAVVVVALLTWSGEPAVATLVPVTGRVTGVGTAVGQHAVRAAGAAAGSWVLVSQLVALTSDFHLVQSFVPLPREKEKIRFGSPNRDALCQTSHLHQQRRKRSP